MEVGSLVAPNVWQLPTLYSLTKSGKYSYLILELHVFSKQSGRKKKIGVNMTSNKIQPEYDYYVHVISRSGFIGMKERVHEPTRIDAGKNIGKSNETNPFVQAYMRALSLFNNKQNRMGYTTNMPSEPAYSMSNEPAQNNCEVIITENQNRRPFPALLKKFSEYSGPDNELYVQRKYNGIRAIARVHNGVPELYSRTNVVFLGFTDIEAEVKVALSGDLSGFYLDGELYKHGTNLQDINGIVRGSNPARKPELVYVVFDMFKPGDSTPYRERYARLRQLFSTNAFKKLVLAGTKRCTRDECVNREYDWALAAGYEGLVIRNPDSPYPCSFNRAQRVNSIVKLKPEQDSEFVITGTKTGERGKFVGQIIFELETPAGIKFNATPNWTEAQSREAWKNRGSFIGKRATVKYAELSRDGVPQQPKVVAIRDYE